MRILFVEPYITFQGLISDTLPGHLSRRRFSIRVIAYATNKKELRSADKLVTYDYLSGINFKIPNIIEYFPLFFNLEDSIKSFKPDIVHINNLPFLTTLQSARTAKKLGIPTVLQVHGVIAKSNLIVDSAQHSFIRAFGRSIFGNAHLVLCLTQEDIHEVLSLGCPANKIRKLCNGVDTKKFQPRRDCEIADLIFWGGRFIEQKGLQYLIQAFQIVVTEKPSAKLMLTGDGRLFSKVQNMVKNMGLEHNVIFKGRVPREDLPSIFGMASVYVLPSLKEGMPYALLEAMACGKAVIGSDIPGIHDVITNEKNGLLVPARDSRALAEAILKLLKDNGLRKQIGDNARNLMVEKYSWDFVITETKKIYDEVLNEASN